MKITNMRVNGEQLTKPHDLKDIFIDESNDKDPKNEPESNKLQNIAYGGISRYIAEKSWNGFQASNTLTREDIISELVKNGLSSERATSAANNILDWLKQEPTRILLVVVAATGGTYAFLEALSAVPGFGVADWSRKKKVLISLLAGGIALIV